MVNLKWSETRLRDINIARDEDKKTVAQPGISSTNPMNCRAQESYNGGDLKMEA